MSAKDHARAERIRMDQEYMRKQAPLRAAWLDESLPQAERDAAKAALHELVAEMTAKCPPITGTFHYTQAQADAAKKAGF